jgi:catechol 2,3-dioxygenase-like lactoylglutathione lyase family enzyme
MPAIAALRGVSRLAVRYHLRNITGKLGLRSSRELRHWPGFPIDSARRARRSEMTTDTTNSGQNASLALGPLGQISMLTRSAAQAEQWYRDVLGLPHIFTFGDLVFFDCDGTRLFIRAVPDEEWQKTSTLYFLVPDIESAHRELSERGIQFSGAPHLIYKDDDTGVEEWMAFFDDPDGNTLAVMARITPSENA